jgi:hypothetical protein
MFVVSDVLLLLSNIYREQGDGRLVDGMSSCDERCHVVVTGDTELSAGVDGVATPGHLGQIDGENITALWNFRLVC